MSKQAGGVKIADDDGDIVKIDESDEESVDTTDDKTDDKTESGSEASEEIEEIPDNEPEETEDDVPAKFDVDESHGDESCLYTVNSKFSSSVLDSDFIDDITFDDDKIVQTSKLVNNEDRITKPILTKYERVRLLSDRTQQLVNGSKPMIKINNTSYSERQIGQMELQRKMIPLIVVRTLPNGNVEHWKLSELEIIN